MADRVLGPGAKGDPENPGVSHADLAASTQEATKEELYEQAQALDIEGRSSMSKEELAEAVTDGTTESTTTKTTKREGR